MERPGLSPRAKVLLPLGLVLLTVLTVHRLFIAEPPSSAIEISGPTMGTSFTVRFDVQALEPEERASATAAIQARLDEVNGLMSTYDPASELSRFNALATTDPVALSRPTLAVLETGRGLGVRCGR